MTRTQIVSYTYTCDVCGTTVVDSDGEPTTRTLSWDGTDFVLDVCSEHGAELAAVLGQLQSFADAGTPVRGRRGRRPQGAAGGGSSRTSQGRRPAANSTPRPKRAGMTAVREWARDNGFTVNTRGRIPANVLAAFAAASSASSAPAPKASSNGASPAATAESAPEVAKASPRRRAPRKAKPAETEG